MDKIFDFLLGWGTPVATTATQMSEMWNSFVSGSTLSQAWWDGTINSITDQITNAPALVESAVGAAFSSIFYLLPDGGNFPPDFHIAATYMGNSLQSVAFMLPIDVMVYCLVLSFNVLMALFAFHLIRSALNFVRGVNTERYGIDANGDAYYTFSNTRRW